MPVFTPHAMQSYELIICLHFVLQLWSYIKQDIYAGKDVCRLKPMTDIIMDYTI